MSSVAVPAIIRQTRAPIETLCVEILTEIFCLCVYGDYCRYFYVFDYLNGPWVFGQVSSSWRYVANNTPLYGRDLPHLMVSGMLPSEIRHP